MQKIKTLNKIVENGVVAVVRAKGLQDALNITKSCLEGGLTIIELTFTTPNANEVIKKLNEEFKNKIILGAGTILDSTSAVLAILAGAKYIVSPHFDRETAIICNRYCIPYMAGCATITEMIRALEMGVSVLKLFPGNNFSPSFIKSIKAPLPQASIMPTGGVNLDNLKDWIKNGAIAVGIGSDLTKGINGNDYSSVTQKAKAYIDAFNASKQ